MNQYYKVDDNCIIFQRILKKTNSTECLVFFKKKPHSLMDISEIIQHQLNMFPETTYVYGESKYNIKATYILNTIIHNTNVEKHIRHVDSLPEHDLTHEPQTVPVTFSESNTWDEIESISAVPFNGWDFYELEWILQRWEKSLGIYDYDEFLVVPSYPKDIYNNTIPPEIFQFIVSMYIEKESIDTLREKYFVLYLFSKDELGKSLLSFFYKYNGVKNIHKLQLFKDLHKMFHKMDNSHEYKRFIFYENYSLSNTMNFRIALFIGQYISFYGMYVCPTFVKERGRFLVRGIQMKHFEFLEFFRSLEDLQKEICMIEQEFSGILTWIGKTHVKKLASKSNFWSYMYSNWSKMNRNVYLWDCTTIKYNDTQLSMGHKITNIFPIKWNKEFYKKNFIPDAKIPLKRKRKL